MNEINVNIFEIVGSSAATSFEAGQKVFFSVDKVFSQNCIAVLDFSNVKLLTPAFLNAAIGQFYCKYSHNEVYQKLRLSSISRQDRRLVRSVIARAKEYVCDKRGLDTARKYSPTM